MTQNDLITNQFKITKQNSSLISKLCFITIFTNLRYSSELFVSHVLHHKYTLGQLTEDLLPNPDLTKIFSIPTYKYFHQMQLELKTSALSVHSNLGGVIHDPVIPIKTFNNIEDLLKYGDLSHCPYYQPQVITKAYTLINRNINFCEYSKSRNRLPAIQKCVFISRKVFAKHNSNSPKPAN